MGFYFAVDIALNGNGGITDQPQMLHFRQSISTPGPLGDNVTALLSPAKSGYPDTVCAMALLGRISTLHFLHLGIISTLCFPAQ
jgi:hypothetical protein